MPGEPGAALPRGADLHAAAEALRPLAHVLEAQGTAARARRRCRRPSSATTRRSSSPAVIGDDDLRGLGVLRHVGERLAQDGQHLLGQLAGDDLVDRAAEGHLRMEAQDRPQLVHQVEHLGVQTLLVDGQLDVEDGLAQLADRLVELVDRLADAHDRLGSLDQAGRALERQADGEQALDHRVVQVAGDAVAVLGQRAVAHQRVQPRVLDGDARRDGQGQHELLVVLGELRWRRACW